MYSSRQAKILSFCLLKDEYVTYHDISEQLQLSSRTIMRELQQIKNSLQSHHLELSSKKGKGIRFLGSQEDKQNLIIEIQESRIDYIDKEERQELLCLELLKTKEIQKLYYYSHKFRVSEATISHDLDDLETFFKTFHIKIIRKPGFGVGIEANESNTRQAMSSLINNAIQYHLMNIDFDRYNVQDVIDQMTVSQNSNMIKVLDKDILKIILQVFKIHHKELELDSIAKSSYIGLLIHLMIAVHRIQDHKPLQDNQEVFHLVNDESAYQRAVKMSEYLSEAFHITFESTECAFIAIHLQSAKSAYVKKDVPVEEYHDLIMKMLTIFRENGYNLLSDYELYESLAAHLKPAMIRLEYNLPIYNPMLVQIQEEFSEIFELTKKACVVFEELYHYIMNDDEIGYLSLHFAAAIERYKTTHLRPIRVGIVCSSGIGLSALLMARLKGIVDNNVEIIPLSITDINSHHCELLISTFDIPEAIYVTPLLNQEDTMRVLKAIETKREQPAPSNQRQTSYDLIALADMVKNLIEQIKLFVIPYTYNKKEVIEIACHNVTQSSNLSQQITHREERGSNVYPTFGFALLHVSTTVVEQNLLHILRPDRKEFIGKDLENIKIVLLMLIPENANHYQKQLMSYISAQLIENEDFYQQLLVQDEIEIKRSFYEILQQWMIEIIKEEESSGKY